MTINPQTPSVTYLGNGSTTVFSFSFSVPSDDEIELLYMAADGTTNVIASNLYSVALNAVAVGELWHDGGTVTYPLSGSGIAVGTSISIIRKVPYDQDVTISNQGRFYPRSVEQGLDLLGMEVQQLKEISDYSLRVPLIGDALDELPTADLRANTFVGFDEDGQPTVLPGILNVVTLPKVINGLVNANHADFDISGLGETGDGAKFITAVDYAIDNDYAGVMFGGILLLDDGTELERTNSEGDDTTNYFGIGFKDLPEGFIFQWQPNTILNFPRQDIGGTGPDFGGDDCKAALGIGNPYGVQWLGYPEINCYGALNGNAVYCWADGDVDDAWMGRVEGSSRRSFDSAVLTINVADGQADWTILGTTKETPDKESHGWMADADQDIEDESVQTPVDQARKWDLKIRAYNVQGAGCISQGGTYGVLDIEAEWQRRYVNDMHTSGYYVWRFGNGSEGWDVTYARGINWSRGARFNATRGIHMDHLHVENLEEEAARIIGGDSLANSEVPGEYFSWNSANIQDCSLSYLGSRKEFLYGTPTFNSSLIKDLSVVLLASPGDSTPKDVTYWEWTNYGAAVSGATRANPCVITTTNFHGFENGDTLDLSTFTGAWTGLNGTTVTVANKTGTTFELQGVNTSAYGAAYSSNGGLCLRNGTNTWLDIGGWEKDILHVGGYVKANGDKYGLAESTDPAYSLRVVDANGAAVVTALTAQEITDNRLARVVTNQTVTPDSRTSAQRMNCYDTGVRVCGDNQSSPGGNTMIVMEGGAAVQLPRVTYKTSTGRIDNIFLIKETGGDIIRQLGPIPIPVGKGDIEGPAIGLFDPAYLVDNAPLPSSTDEFGWLLDYGWNDENPSITATNLTAPTPSIMQGGEGYVDGGFIDLKDRGVVSITTIDGSGTLTAIERSMTPSPRPIIDPDGVCASQSGSAGVDLIINGAMVNQARRTITGITAANPGVVTFTGGNISANSKVFINAVAGMTEVNNRVFIATNVNNGAGTFQLYDEYGNAVNTSAYTAYGGAGTVSGVANVSNPVVNTGSGASYGNRITLTFAANENTNEFTLRGQDTVFGEYSVLKKVRKTYASYPSPQVIIDKFGFMNGTSTVGGVAYFPYASELILKSSAAETSYNLTVYGDLTGTGTTSKTYSSVCTTADTYTKTTGDFWNNITSVRQNKNPTGKITVGTQGDFSETVAATAATTAIFTRCPVTVYAINSVDTTTGALIAGPLGTFSASSQFNSRIDSEGGAGAMIGWTWSVDPTYAEYVVENEGAHRFYVTEDGTSNLILTIDNTGVYSSGSYDTPQTITTDSALTISNQASECIPLTGDPSSQVIHIGYLPYYGTRIAANQFSISGDVTAIFPITTPLKTVGNTAIVSTTVSAVSFGAGITTITTTAGGILDTDLKVYKFSMTANRNVTLKTTNSFIGQKYIIMNNSGYTMTLKDSNNTMTNFADGTSIQASLFGTQWIETAKSTL